MPRRTAYACGIAAVAFLLGFVVYREGPRLASHAVWREIAWPFSRDAWPAGRAFRCASPTCEGAELYVRPKIGFCNCATGVADDEEVDRVADLDLISERFGPVAAGQEVTLAGLQGRARRYRLEMPDGTTRSAVGFAVSQRCDVVVAVVQARSQAPADLERVASELLSSAAVAAWLHLALE
jgi:hypothetical protein